MFTWREATKIHIGRAAFVAICLLPTAAVLTYAIGIRTDSYRQLHEQRLSSILGCRVLVSGVRTPRPQVTLYEKLELRDIETGQRIASLPFVEVHTAGPIVTLKLPYPATIDGARLSAFARPQLLRSPESDSPREIRLECQNLTIKLADGDLTWIDVAAQVRFLDECGELTLSARLAAASGDGLLQLSISRAYDNPTEALVRLDAAGVPLPCSLAAPFWPGTSRLGAACTFQGQATIVASPLNWQAELHGELAQIDFDQLFRDRFPHHLAAEGRLTFDHATLRNGRVEAASGRLLSEDGQIGRSLVLSAQANLKLRTAATAGASTDILPFRLLALDFALAPDGLTVRGACAEPAGAILVGRAGEVLLQQGTAEPQSPLNLVRMLVPDVRWLVPATKETDWITHALPVPTILPERENNQPAQAKTIRVTPATVTK